MKINKLYKGDKVVMHDCMEARGRENVIWECTCDSYEMCGSEVVFLKGYSGSFDTEFLRKVEGDKRMTDEDKKISLAEYAEKSGNEWVLEEPETYYRYKYEVMTFQEWAELFG